MKEEITLNELLPNQFYINKDGDMVAEISLKSINEIADILTNYYRENKRLNNIINELEKYLIKQIDYTDGCDMFLDEQHEAYSNSLNKLQELKGVDKN